MVSTTFAELRRLFPEVIPLRGGRCGGRFERLAGESSGGVDAAEAIGQRLAVALGDVLVREVEAGRAIGTIVSIAGDEVDQAAAEEFGGGMSGFRAEAAE